MNDFEIKTKDDYSNTTFVKVKYGFDIAKIDNSQFKYNIC